MTKNKSLPAAFVVETERGPVDLAVRRSNKARRLRIRVLEDKLELVVPLRASTSDARDFVASVEEWIVARAEVLATERTACQQCVFWQGRELAVVPDLSCPKPDLCPVKNELRLTDISREAVRSALANQARPVLQNTLDKAARRMGVEYGRLSVRNQRTRWGSCSSRRTISLNWRLVMAPPEVLDYLCVHELAHLSHMDHSAKFWSLVEQHCPDYRVHERWLRENGRRLLAF